MLFPVFQRCQKHTWCMLYCGEFSASCWLVLFFQQSITMYVFLSFYNFFPKLVWCIVFCLCQLFTNGFAWNSGAVAPSTKSDNATANPPTNQHDTHTPHTHHTHTPHTTHTTHIPHTHHTPHCVAILAQVWDRLSGCLDWAVVSIERDVRSFVQSRFVYRKCNIVRFFHVVCVATVGCSASSVPAGSCLGGWQRALVHGSRSTVLRFCSAPAPHGCDVSFGGGSWQVRETAGELTRLLCP